MIEVYDFFSGCGGTSDGLRRAGLEIVLGLDSDQTAISSFKQNFPHANAIWRDIKHVQPLEIKKFVKRRRPILFCGCAPCQPFSRQNMTQLQTSDPRSSLLREFERFVAYYRPDYILVENVPGLQKVQIGRGPLQFFKGSIKRLGYHFEEGVVSARAYGVPQKRDRFILLASLNAGLSIPPATHGPGKLSYTTVRDFIADLPVIAAGETHPTDLQHSAARLSDLNLARITATPEGKGREAWPAHLAVRCHVDHSGHSDVYGRLAWDRQAAGLTTRCISYSNGRFGHPEQHRALSVREAACLQTFGREFTFCGNLAARAKQVGNAVPPAMAAALGRAILAHAISPSE